MRNQQQHIDAHARKKVTYYLLISTEDGGACTWCLLPCHPEVPLRWPAHGQRLGASRRTLHTAPTALRQRQRASGGEQAHRARCYSHPSENQLFYQILANATWGRELQLPCGDAECLGPQRSRGISLSLSLCAYSTASRRCTAQNVTY